MVNIKKLISLVTNALMCKHKGIRFDSWDEIQKEWNKIDNSLSKNAIRKRIQTTMYDHYLDNRDQKYDKVVIEYFENTYAEFFDGFHKNEYKTEPFIETSNDKRHHYHEQSSTHTFYLKSAPKPVLISNDNLKIVKKRYSNWDGNTSTINEICRDFKIPRSWLIEMKTILGWTHDSDPFLPSDILTKDDDELIEEALEDRRASIYQKFENAKYKDMEDMAKKYMELESFVVKPLIEKIEDKMGKYVQSDNLSRPIIRSNEKVCVVLPIFDVHVGKLAFVDQYTDLNQFTDDCMRSFDNIFGRIAEYNIEELIIPVGSDFFHVDNMQQATTKGTLQSNTMGVNTIDMFLAGMELSYRMNDRLVEMGIKNTIFHTISGNHDYLLSISLGEILKQRYGTESHVTVHVDKWLRRYHKYGTSLLGLTHGDELPLRKNNKRSMMLNKFMLHEARKFGINTGNVERYYFFSGHQHKFDASDEEGVMDIIVPSLAKADFWHHQNGYDFKEKKIASYILNANSGLSNIVLAD